MMIDDILLPLLTGSTSTKMGHVERALRIEVALASRFKVKTVFAWKQKHLKWYLDFAKKKFSENTYHDCRRTVHVICYALGKEHWLPHLGGVQKTGRPLKRPGRK